MSLGLINPKAESLRVAAAQLTNISAAKGIQSILKTNLGPRGTLKMLVGGAGDIKLTKDGSILLGEMQIQHPTAVLIARTASDMDNITGDGTTSNVLLTGEILKQAERHLSEGVHPRVIIDGFDAAREQLLKTLDAVKVKPEDYADRELLLNVARTSLRTKLDENLTKLLTEIVTDALLTIRKPGKPIDLFMVEIATMRHRRTTDSKLVRGLVLDHGARHPDMPKRVENAFIFTCNVDFEYTKPEHNTVINVSSNKEREQMVEAEHRSIDDKVDKVIELKRKACAEKSKDGKEMSFVIMNQKGIDPTALDRFAKEGILALRRCKRRNMERLTLACGGTQINSLDDMSVDCLGRAGLVYEQVLGEEKYTFVEKVENPFSVTILVKGPNNFLINQIKDAIRDGLRAVNNAITDQHLVPGGGAFEIAGYLALRKLADSKEVQARHKTGIEVISEALLVIPKTLSENSGFDKTESLSKLVEAHKHGVMAGLDLETGEAMDPAAAGVWDNYRVKRQMLYSSIVISTQLLLVDEIMKAGKSQGQNAQAQGPDMM